jgi:glutathione synthase/RimK-type ligase-like ATP-grasp enzyme
MKEVIILEVNETKKSHLIQDFLKQKKIDYRILADFQQEPTSNLTKQGGKKTQKTDIFANYGEAKKNQAREKELKLWDNADLDEQLNTDGEWWS